MVAFDVRLSFEDESEYSSLLHNLSVLFMGKDIKMLVCACTSSNHSCRVALLSNNSRSIASPPPASLYSSIVCSIPFSLRSSYFWHITGLASFTPASAFCSTDSIVAGLDYMKSSLECADVDAFFLRVGAF